MTARRRTIWISDEDWADMEAEAKEEGKTVSAFLRAAKTDRRMLNYRVSQGDSRAEIALAPAPPPAIRAMTQAERDTILRKVNRTGRE